MEKLKFQNVEMQQAYDNLYNEVEAGKAANPFHGFDKIDAEVDKACRFFEFSLANFKADTIGFSIAAAVVQLVYFRAFHAIETHIGPIADEST